jgi:hypothetical protein
MFCKLRIPNSPDVDASQLDWRTVGAITHEWFRKGSVVDAFPDTKVVIEDLIEEGDVKRALMR